MLAIALSLDALIVAISLGKDPFRVAFSFAFFQMMLFALGYFSFYIINQYVIMLNSIIASIILIILAIKMFIDYLKKDTNQCIYKYCMGSLCSKNKCEKTHQYKRISNQTLIAFAIAVSIDAFASGGTVVFFDFNLIITVLTIGLTTFILSYIGCFFGIRLHKIIGKHVNILGSIILFVLAIYSFIL